MLTQPLTTNQHLQSMYHIFLLLRPILLSLPARLRPGALILSPANSANEMPLLQAILFKEDISHRPDSVNVESEHSGFSATHSTSLQGCSRVWSPSNSTVHAISRQGCSHGCRVRMGTAAPVQIMMLATTLEEAAHHV